MWRLRDTYSQEEQGDSYSGASDGISMLASKSDDSVIFVAEWLSPSIQGPGIIKRATIQVLPTFLSSGSDTSSSISKSLLCYIFYQHTIYCVLPVIITVLFDTFWGLFLVEILPVMIAETPLSSQETT